MTSNDIFLGGGTSSGSYNVWTIPNITGTVGSNQDVGPTGVFSLVTNWHKNSGADTYASTIRFDLTNLSSYVNHIGLNIRPNYYTIEFWIKFK